MTGIALPSPYNLQSFCCFFNGPKSVIEWYKHLGEQILDQIFLKVRALSNRMKTQHRGSAFLSIIQNQNCENPPAEVTPPTGSGTTAASEPGHPTRREQGYLELPTARGRAGRHRHIVKKYHIYRCWRAPSPCFHHLGMTDRA